jgi:hypothetical protein
MPTTSDGKKFDYTKAGIAAADAHQSRINRKRQNMGVMKGGSRNYSFKPTTKNVRKTGFFGMTEEYGIKKRLGPDGLASDYQRSQLEQRVAYGGPKSSWKEYVSTPFWKSHQLPKGQKEESLNEFRKKGRAAGKYNIFGFAKN